MLVVARLPSFASMTDLDPERWREHDDIWTDSLWLIGERDRTGAHNAKFHGNFVPQIPYQLIRRYTRPGEWVVDPFAGSGTSLIEAARLGRNAIGVDLDGEAVRDARARLATDPLGAAEASVVAAVGDSRSFDFGAALAEHGADQAALAILHPPYHDIINFTDDPRDLSNAVSLTEFLAGFEEVLANTVAHLERGRMLAVVIGDKYAKGEWIPLGWHTMSVAMAQGLQLKSIIVKNFTASTAGKRTSGALWRYRAMRGGFYVFKHEYILLMRKLS